jgi:hypothetical protein
LSDIRVFDFGKCFDIVQDDLFQGIFSGMAFPDIVDDLVLQAAIPKEHQIGLKNGPLVSGKLRFHRMTDLQNLAFGLPDGIFEPANFFMYIAGFPEIDFIKTDPLPKVIDISLTKASGYGDPLEASFMFLAAFFMCSRIGHFSAGEFIYFFALYVDSRIFSIRKSTNPLALRR